MTARANDVNIDTSDIDALLSGVGRRNQPNVAAQRVGDGTTASRQDGMPSVTKSKFTALLAPADALAFDELAYGLRAQTGRRVEKAEILRALIRLGLDHPETARALGEALDRRQPQSDPLPEA